MDPGDPEPPPRQTSIYEIDAPYLGDTAAFWARDDIYVMQPDLEPLDLWPPEIVDPDAHGIRIVVLLPGDYRGRSDGSLPAGILMIRASGTEAEPFLVTYAPAVGADILAAPHAAERLATSKAQLGGFRLWNQNHQYFHGLTFSDGVAACWIRNTINTVIDSCAWNNTGAQPLRIRFDAHDCLVQRCVMQRFVKEDWGNNDTVAIQVSDGPNTGNRIVSNVILNYTDAYQHTDRDGEPYGLGAGTIIDNNFFGFTAEAYTQEPEGELMCGENAIDMKMGGTEADPVRITNNVFFGARATKAGCAASGSGGYAVTLHRLGTWIEFSNNLFVDNDAGIFLNAYFLNNDAAQGRIDPKLTITGNLFSGVRSMATAFPSRTGHVLTGSSAAVFRGNSLVACDRLMEQEPLPGTGDLVIQDNDIYGDVLLDPRDQLGLEADGNVFHPPPVGTSRLLHIPWVARSLQYTAPN